MSPQSALVEHNGQALFRADWDRIQSRGRVTGWKSCGWSLAARVTANILPKRVRRNGLPFINGVHLWRKRFCGQLLGRVDRTLAGGGRSLAAGGRFHSTAERSIRLEVYCERKTEAHDLVTRFGGRASEVRKRKLASGAVHRPRDARSVIGGRLLVTSRTEEIAEFFAPHGPRCRQLCIPAAMAFGTGEHATTAMCLRLLAEVARRHAPGSWDMLDLGTGSGILALAAHRFGARHALGIDNDPHAVRTARENARLNGLTARAVRFAQGDLHTMAATGSSTVGGGHRQFVQRIADPAAARGDRPGGRVTG